MSQSEIKAFVEKKFKTDFVPALMNFIRIPNSSKGFDPNWNQNKTLHKAANLICDYARSLGLKNASIDILQDPGRTPFVFIDVPATRLNDNRTILLYGHYDKMPPYEGWDPDKGAYTPIIKDGKLYGRGGCDDGYSSFSALTAIKCIQDLGLVHPRLVLIVEGAEESDGSELDYYFLKLIPAFGNVALFICMDAGCDGYNNLWVTTSLRGVCGCHLNIKTLSHKLESQFYSGAVPDLYLILRTFISKIQADDGSILIDEFKYPEDQISERRRSEMKKLAENVGEHYKDQIPVHGNTKPLNDDVYQLILNKTWRPCLCMNAIDGITSTNENDNVIDSLSADIGIRLPPHVDGMVGLEAIEKLAKEFKPFGCEITVSNKFTKEGWDLANFGRKLENVLDNASKHFFGNEAGFRGEGGSIPFLNLFQTHFPKADIANLGVAGQECCEHGPNEFLVLDAAKKFIMALAYTLSRY